MWQRPKTWNPPPARPDIMRKLDRLFMGAGPSAAEKRLAKHERSEWEREIEQVPRCEVCASHHLGAAPPGHDLIVMGPMNRLEVVKPSKPKPERKRGLFR